MRRLIFSFASLAILVAPELSEAASAPRTLAELAHQVTVILSSGTTLLVLFGMVVYFWGIAYNMNRFGEGEYEVFKQYFFWGILIIFLMVSIWGVLGLLKNTFFSSNQITGGGGTGQNCTEFGNCQSN
jgi:hypothetical protein